MAKHTVSVHPATALVVQNSDLVVEITSDGKKLGELWISKGTIDWRPRSGKYAKAELSWEGFDRLMKAVGNGTCRHFDGRSKKG